MYDKNLRVLKENETNAYGILVERDGYITPDIQPKLTEDVAKDAKDDSKSLIVYATLQKADTPNRNGRVYPYDILDRENKRYQEVIKHNTSFHQLDHPDDSVVALKGGSPHRILKTWWDGKYLFGELEVITSPGYRNYGIVSVDGDLMALYLEYGFTLGVSSRGIGSLQQENGYNMVQDDFELICWDVVSSPSTPGSYIYPKKDDWKRYDQKPEDLDDINTNTDEAMQDDDDFMKKLQQSFFQ